MSTTLALARTITRRLARSLLDPTGTSVGDAFVDDAIRWAASRFCDETNLVRASTDIALTAEDRDVDFSSITNFRPERFIRARALANKVTFTLTEGVTSGSFKVTYTPVEGDAEETDAIAYNDTTATVQSTLQNLAEIENSDITVGGAAGAWVITINVDLEDFGTFTLTTNNLSGGTSPSVDITQLAEADADVALINLRKIQNYRAYPDLAYTEHPSKCIRSGLPSFLGFDDHDTAQVYPEPNANGTLRVWYWAPFTAWTPGSQGAYSGSVTYNEGDVVSSSSNAYVCILQALNQTPASSATYWTLLGTTSVVAVATPSTQTLNIPDDLLERVLAGAAGKLMDTDNNAGAKAASQRLLGEFERFLSNSLGRGSVAGRS